MAVDKSNGAAKIQQITNKVASQKVNNYKSYFKIKKSNNKIGVII